MELPPLREDPQAKVRLPALFKAWLTDLRKALRPVPTFVEGDGSPEGVVSAKRGARYFDRTATDVPVVYIKTTQTGNTGWVGAPSRSFPILWTANTISEDITIPDDVGAVSFGSDITIADDVTVTVGDNSTWSIGI